jgi:site-specific recombinase
MNLSYIKILPLLVFVAMLAFSVRFAEVAMDISRLTGSAVAADAPHAAPEKKEESAAEAKHEEAKPAEAAHEEAKLALKASIKTKRPRKRAKPSP